MCALDVNACALRFGEYRGARENADMPKRRDTALAKLMESHDGGRGISDNALARLTKIPQSTITRIANGTTKTPDRPAAKALATFFRVTEDEVVGAKPLRAPRPAEPAVARESQPLPAPAALEIARAWERLSPIRQDEFRDALYWACYVEARLPVYRRSRKAETLAAFERSLDVDHEKLRHKATT